MGDDFPMMMARGFIFCWLAASHFLWAETTVKNTPHTAFTPLVKPKLPQVINRQWIQKPVDHFILARLEASGLKPAARAGKRALVRRVYFDLIGLPPSPAVVAAFVADDSPEALAKLVDRLLASPHYGERWGRHWLDVARYGDSNGGDENHDYPHAWRYRNYIIDAFNRDVPYDQFLREQIAGDLLPEPKMEATGFLAIGTKILAEKNPVKKRADIVDEQLDTFGRAVLGLSIGCARCHDHKFDPISHRDYYAMAGIFHSTGILDANVPARVDDAKEKARRARVAELDQKIAAAKKTLKTKGALEWEAEKFTKGNVIIDRDHYGKGIGIISDPGRQLNFAEYTFTVPKGGAFYVRLRYAAANARPGTIAIDGKMRFPKAIAQKTGGWFPPHQKWFTEGRVELKAGAHTMRIASQPMMSHIDRVQLMPVTAAHEALAKLEDERARLAAAAPKPMKVMAVNEGKIADARINRRGNPADLGAVVPRGFLASFGPKAGELSPKHSGRLELANWLANKRHPLTARVMVNRLWRWHFGRGIVATPDNFGIRGARPTHPALLDWLAARFIEHDWSIKAMHREIVLSATYQMAAGIENKTAQIRDPSNQLYWRREVRRLEAEAVRDAMLAVSGRLDARPPLGPPPVVKKQDPSPADLANNRRVVERYPHRTVYLPVVRCHVYDFLTLLDFPNASTPVGHRDTTTVPTQALLMLNNPFVIAQAEAIAETARRGSLDSLYTRLFARPATAAEKKRAADFLKRYTARKDEAAAWTALCQTLLISNEFLHTW